MESSEMKPLIQERSNGLANPNEHVDNMSLLNTLRNDIHSLDGDSAIDINESHQSCSNSSISSDLITERIYHNIIKERDSLNGDTQADENELKYCNLLAQNFGYPGTDSAGDFSAVENVQEFDTTEQTLFESNYPQAEVSNGDKISQYSDYFSHDSTIDEDLGVVLQNSPTINLHRNEITSDSENKSKEEKEKQNSDQDSSSLIDRAYTCVMNRYSGFKHFNPDQFSGNKFGKRGASFLCDEEDDVTSSRLTKSDSIRNLLEAMLSMGVKLDFPELQPADSVAPDSTTTPDVNEPLPEDVSEVDKTAGFRNQHSRNFEFNTDKPTTSEDSGIKNSKTNEIIHSSIQKLLLKDLQTTGCLNEESAKALSTTVDEFSHWISKLITENERLRKSMEDEKLDCKSENCKPNFPTPQSAPQDLMRSMINSESTNNENLDESQTQENFKCFESILCDFQKSKTEQEKLVLALKAAMDELSESANKFHEATKNMEQINENRLESAQSSENLEESGILRNFECFTSKLRDFQISESKKANSIIAFKDGLSKFLESFDEILTVNNKKVEQVIEKRLESAQSSKNNHFDNDVINIRDASGEEICDLLGNVQSKHDLFKCKDSECKTMLVGHFLASSNLNTLIIRKNIDEGQVKYLLIEISPNIKVKTTCKANKFNGDGSFTMNLITSHYSFSLSL